MAIENIGLYPITIDVDGKYAETTVYANDNDTNSRGLLITLMKDGVPFDSTGINLRIGFLNSEGKPRLYDCETVDALTGKYRVFYPTEMLLGNGGRTVKLEIKAYDGNGALLNYAPLFVYINASEIHDDALEGTNEASTLLNALGKVENINESFNAINDDLILKADKTYVDNKNDEVNAQLAQTVEKNDYYITPEPFSSMQDAIDYAITNKKKLRIPGGTYNFSTGLVIDGIIDIEGSLNKVVFDFSAMSEGTAIVVGETNEINGLVMKGLTVIGNSNLTGLELNKTSNISKSIVNAHFSDMLFQNFGTGLKTSFIWCNQFDNMRFQGCIIPATFGNQTNNCLFNRCSFVSFTGTITLDNCESLLFNACEFANAGTSYALSLYQSNIQLNSPYIENVAKLANVGVYTESYPSIIQIYGGIVTGEIRFGQHKTGIEVHHPRTTVGLMINSQSNEYHLYQPSIKLGWYEGDKKMLHFFDGKSSFPYISAWGGTTVPHTFNSDGYAEVTATNGILVSDQLEVGKQYVLAYRIKSDETMGIRHNTSVPFNKQPLSDTIFETRYIPFVAVGTALRLEWSGLAHIEHLSIAEGLHFI